jgi:hypothetical protein
VETETRDNNLFGETLGGFLKLGGRIIPLVLELCDQDNGTTRHRILSTDVGVEIRIDIFGGGDLGASCFVLVYSAGNYIYFWHVHTNHCLAYREFKTRSVPTNWIFANYSCCGEVFARTVSSGGLYHYLTFIDIILHWEAYLSFYLSCIYSKCLTKK